MPDTVLAPFSEQDRQELLDKLRQLADLNGDFDRAERCGVDCRERRRIADELRRQLESFRVEYFP